MSVETYGDHQEAAAAALVQLLVRDTLPTIPAQMDQLMHCREVAVDALRQRLYHLGLNSYYSPSVVPEPTAEVTLVGLDGKLATLVDRMIFEFPSLPLAERRSVVEVLTAASPDSIVELWRHTAIELLAGTHALDAAEQRPWLTDPGAGWYLMRDVAVTMEALLILDHRLDEVGMLNEHTRPDAPLALEERRLLLSQCARIATWHATSDSPDLATPFMGGHRTVAGPVHTIGTVADLAPAQRQLAKYLAPLNAHDSFFTGEPEISADTAKMVIASQIFLTRQFETSAAGTPGADAVCREFANRRGLLEDVQARMTHLVDVTSPGRHLPITWQQGELTTAVRRMQRDAGGLSMTSSQLLDLANATHEVTQNAAKSLRREMLRDTSNLRIADTTHQVGATQIYRKHPLELCVTALINAPAPAEPITTHSNPLQRAALRQTLDVTPTTRRAPSPYPRARGLTAPDFSI